MITTHNFLKQNSQGFTLIEIIIASLILFLIVGFLGYLSIKHFWIYNSQVAELHVGSDARFALDDIDNYARGAYRVISSYDIYSTGSQTLILQVPSINSSHQVIGGKYDNVVFYLSGESLIRQIFPDAVSSRSASTRTLATGVDADSFSFSYDNATHSLVKQITTSITIKQGNPNNERSITVSSESFLRNY